MKTTPVPQAKLLLPEAGLSNCIFGAFVRDIRNCDLSQSDRFNHFASSPLCAISWIFEGRWYHLPDKGKRDNPTSAPEFPKIAFSGPYAKPQTSWSSGEFYAMTLAFYPDALAQITGIEVAKFANITLPADKALPEFLMPYINEVLVSENAEKGFEQFVRRLEPLWQSKREGSSKLGFLVKDWSRALAVKAAMSGVGKSTRQIERRIKNWTGHSQQKLDAFANSEKAFKHALEAKEQGSLNLADLSADLGYADQSHMGRRVKEVTGFSPGEFMKRYEEDETFWSFRLMGMRF